MTYKAVTALGRLISIATTQPSGSGSDGATNLDYTTFSEDSFGNINAINRQKDPSTITSPVSTLLTYDSLDHVIASSHDLTATQSITYNNLGEPTQVSWQDATGSATVTYVVISDYDAAGRIVHREAQANGSADPDSLVDYVYDQGSGTWPELTQTNTLGRLSKATSSTGSVYVSYGAYGAPNGRVYTDTLGSRYVNRYSLRPDGIIDSIKFNVSDDNYADGQVSYTYDSALRVRDITYAAPSTNTTLYESTSIDTLGHVLGATYGEASYSSSYEPSGRRLLLDAEVSARVGFATDSRAIAYTGYDSAGRELSRLETQHSLVTRSQNMSQTYDALGRLATYSNSENSAQWSYVYDALGNVESGVWKRRQRIRRQKRIC